MKVETYETAVFSEKPENLALQGEILQLIEDLNLEGQKELAHSASDTKGLCPYRKMTAREVKVFKLCFPRETKLTEYKECLIPLRILQVASHAKEWFPKILVWHPEPGLPDPILVGYEKASWDGEPFLLARWGEALDTFEILCEKAKKLAISKLTVSMCKAETELASAKQLFSSVRDLDIMDIPLGVSFYTNS